MRRIVKIKSAKFAYFEWRMLGRIAKLSIPSILQQSFVSVGNLFIQSLVNSCGIDVMAGYSSAIKLNTFAVTCFTTVGNSVSSFTAQNTGAGEYLRVRKGFRVGVLLAAGIAVVFSLVYVIFADNLIYIFMDSSDANNIAAAEAGKHFLRIVSPFFLAVSIKVTADGVLRGAGLVAKFMITTFSDLILRVAFAFILEPLFEATGIWLSWPVGWTIAMVISLVFYFTHAKKITAKAKELQLQENN
jgi:Na+-driven multidrug efflux pump